jgi:hypothetical protein
MVLICHYHDGAISQVFDVLVFLAHLDAKDLDEILDLRVFHNLLVRSLTDI